MHVLGCDADEGLCPERGGLPRWDHQIAASREARRRPRGVAEVAPVEARVLHEVVVVVGAPRARLGRPVAIMGEEDGVA